MSVCDFDNPKLPTDAQARKNAPIYRGVMKYFPRALAAVAELSRIGNEQHNPGQPMHWAREKSTDHGDCIARHQIDAGTIDIDGVRHSTKVLWRAFAQLEIELEEAEKAQEVERQATAYLVNPDDEKQFECNHLAHAVYLDRHDNPKCGNCGAAVLK